MRVGNNQAENKSGDNKAEMTECSTNKDDNKMAVMPVGKLLMSMAAPMMLSFFIQALYNIVDSIFVAQISEDALTAVSLAYPMQNVMTAIGVGLGVGISALIPRALARKNLEEAKTYVNTGIFLNLCFFILFVILGIFLVEPFYRIQTDIQEINQSGSIYLRICWCVSIGSFFGQYFEKMLLSTGNALQAMLSQTGGAVFNLVFDPLLIFGIGPFPEMGVAGAAAATVLGQIFAAVIALIFNLRQNKWVSFDIRKVFRPDKRAVVQIYEIGVPSMITIGLSSAMSFCVNQVLLIYSTTATAVYGIWIKLQNFYFMPAFGMNNALIPILSYNYSRGLVDRIKNTISYAVRFIVVLMLCLTVVFELIPDQLLYLFNASDIMLSIGETALRVCVLSLVFGGVNVILSTTMQAMDHSLYTLIINILRQFVLIAGLFYILSVVFRRLDLVWIAIPLGESITMLVTIVLYKKMMKKINVLHESKAE